MKKKKGFFKKEIVKIERFFGKKYPIVFKDDMKYGYCDENKNIIYISLKMSDDYLIKTIIHEFIHLAWNADHDHLSRKCHYYSWSSKKDYFTDFFYKVIF